ncbi:hypothetical protein OESDEN_07503 [Oesophagostomum dentatum]|uniref:Uncharacterized protein n=1 Tax=Oesophagostomum dentatum TaxID=61180 RepID=A0A0B1T8Y7_OESDE|nr:hypothetical protein OESDEN_07503 [Oesophagostomum dentatum]
MKAVIVLLFLIWCFADGYVYKYGRNYKPVPRTSTYRENSRKAETHAEPRLKNITISPKTRNQIARAILETVLALQENEEKIKRFSAREMVSYVIAKLNKIRSDTTKARETCSVEKMNMAMKQEKNGCTGALGYYRNICRDYQRCIERKKKEVWDRNTKCWQL